MQLQLAKTLVGIVEGCDESCEIRENYSGRGMYGESTTGIIVDNLSIFMTSIISNPANLIDDEGYPIFERIGMLRTDNMANQIIIY